MNAVARLDRYLDELRQRLQRRIGARAALALAATALLVTLLAALWLRQLPEAQLGIVIARWVLAAATLALLAGLLWRPLRALRLREGAAEFERLLPEQQGRIETYLDQRRRAAQGEAATMLELLAEDAARIADRAPSDVRLPARSSVLPAVAAACALLLIAAVVFKGGNDWTAGARSFWLGTPVQASLPMNARRIDVQPGDVAVRRNQDVAISAKTVGFVARDAQLHVRFGDSADWEDATMQVDAQDRIAFTLYALREPAAYYVSAGGLRSREHRLRVVDPPRIEQLRLTYVYPAWTGLKPRTQETGGDVEAVAGTRVRVELRTDAPLEAPVLVVDEQGRPLSQQSLVGRGEFTVSEPGQYRIGARFGGELIALTDNFRIAVTPDEKPNVEIKRPGRDYQASSIEEVPVAVHARDDFRLEGLELRYAVNGGAWKSEPLDAGSTDINAAALLRLEELRQSGTTVLEPGDIVSYYAVARDHRQAVQTDLFLIQVQPFDRRYTQSQAAGGGGGGGGGDDGGKISERQREILLATFNLDRDSRDAAKDPARVADSAAMLADLQKTLADQARTLVERANARALTGADENVTRFVRALEEAAKAMKPAAERLAKTDLQPAISDEQRALQHLLRAEAVFRDIQVAQQSGSRGGGGGGGQAGRDVAEMTELELDLQKNQYETESQMPAAAANAAEDDSLRRLRELARRQEQLAREQARQAAGPEAQRWQQEQLRREAEDLRQQLEQLAQRQSSQGGQQQQRGGQQSGGQQSSAAREALAQVEQAIKSMREGRPGAQENLKRAQESLERGRQEAIGERFGSLAEGARDLVREQQRSEEALRAAVSGGRNLNFEQAVEMAERKRAIQAELERLQVQMQAARQQGGERAPDAASRVGAASRKLDEEGTAARLARSALEIDRGRGTPAAARDGLITEALQSLQKDLDEAARVAGAEAGQGGDEQAARPQDLLAELGQLRRALQQAQQQAQQGQQGGQRGGIAGGGRGGAEESRLLPGTALIAQARGSAQRLQDLGERLPADGFAEADVSVLRELAGRLRRAGADPVSGEYARMQGLVNQLELVALRVAAESARTPATRTELRGAESSRDQDKVAEYYRRLGRP